jgi:hypothetical protein
MRMRHIAICGLSVRLYNIFPHYLINGTIFEKNVVEQNVCFEFLYQLFLKHLSFPKELGKMWSKMCIGLYGKCPSCVLVFMGSALHACQSLMKLEFLGHFRKALIYQVS